MDLEQLLSKAKEIGWSYQVGSEPSGTKDGWYHEEKTTWNCENHRLREKILAW